MQGSLDVMVEALVGTYAVLVAALVGSFINLAADRVPRRESVVRPRSRCRSCGRVLNLVDLIPVAGYLIRAGRCATCTVFVPGCREIDSPIARSLPDPLTIQTALLSFCTPSTLCGSGPHRRRLGRDERRTLADQARISLGLIECVRADCSVMSPARMSWFSDLSNV